MRGTKARNLRKAAHNVYPQPNKVGYAANGAFYGQNWRRFYRMLKRGSSSVVVV